MAAAYPTGTTVAILSIAGTTVMIVGGDGGIWSHRDYEADKAREKERMIAAIRQMALATRESYIPLQAAFPEPPAPNHFAQPRRMAPMRMRPQVVGPGRAARRLLAPNCKGGLR